ncbi:hypothetical protein RRG48_05085 [Mycoplasmopsis canis]|uniref:hypothetical protein n=1 Tax=Mycoplasmopsis cynos TaxID=171284 RepID=UPI002AFF95FF|nr:hypothetical protein [Mycoplasmopsis cynos]WQQ13492.1 hypothetical protein RRG58_01955 [Mycoplasmopsis cynos]WQQ13930.1 hypothetical protein RRG52_00040 [Mycoplasmopsis cynos]
MKKIFKLLLGISGLISVPFVISCNTKSQNLVLENFDDKLVKNVLNTFVIASHENLVRKIDEYLKNPNSQARINEWKKRNAQELLLLNSIKDIDTFKKNNKTLLDDFLKNISKNQAKEFDKIFLLNSFLRTWIVEIISRVNQILNQDQQSNPEILNQINWISNFAILYRNNFLVSYINQKISVLNDKNITKILGLIKKYQSSFNEIYNKYFKNFTNKSFKSNLEESFKNMEAINKIAIDIEDEFKNNLSTKYFTNHLSNRKYFGLVSNYFLNRKEQTQSGAINIAFTSLDELKEVTNDAKIVDILNKFQKDFKNPAQNIENDLIVDEFGKVKLFENNTLKDEILISIFNKDPNTHKFKFIDDYEKNKNKINLSTLIPNSLNHIIKLSLPINRSIFNKLSFNLVNNKKTESLSNIGLGLYEFNNLVVSDVKFENDVLKVSTAINYDQKDLNKTIDFNSFDILFVNKSQFISPFDQQKILREVTFDIYVGLNDEIYNKLIGNKLARLQKPTEKADNKSSNDKKARVQKLHENYLKEKNEIFANIKIEVS